MAKLHEILAVEGDLENVANKLVNEATATFSKKPDHFIETVRRVEMLDEARKDEDVEEHKAMVTTVRDKLDFVRPAVAKYFDVFVAKETTNQAATADIVVNGVTLVAGVPVTALLGLQNRLKNLRAMYEAIPTLQPGKHWAADTSQGAHVYRARHTEVRHRTEKQIQSKVLYEATKEHPAQIEKWVSDVVCGRIHVDEWSGMLSPADKSRMLERLDDLIRAVKRARQRANDIEVVERNLGAVLLDYVHG